LFTFTVLFSCSVEKNTFVNRNYHNLTAHYNVYFNGNEAMKAGLLKIETQVEEDYTKILPVYKESLPKTEALVSSDMTTAIEKGTKLIKLHSITKPPKKKSKSGRYKKSEIKSEYNRWVDDAYLMMGRAYLYKKEYIMATSTFQLIIRKYKNDPVRFEAYLWLIRSLSEDGRFSEAAQLVQMLESDKEFPKKLEGELAIVSADMHMKQQHYDEAIHSLDIGIKKIKGNKRKSRYTFILGQLYQETGKRDQALAAYRQVIRRSPEYQMLFNARIRSAQVLSGEGNIAQLRKDLNKMRKKKWNQPYLDQIYYALGNISFNEGKIDDAIELYKKSAAVSRNNIHQKALSSLTLGDIYFDRKQYIPSGAYYDSAMTIIDESYPNYELISEKYNTLDKLVENLKTVETQDSLQKLAGLPKAELDKKIALWISNEKEKQQQELMVDNDPTAYYRANSNRMRLNTAGSSFYFYNTSTVSYGKKEFERLWGKRQNEDNWRRKNKNASFSEDGDEAADGELAEEIAGEEAARADDPLTTEYYLQDIPLTDSMMSASHTKIRDARFDAGSILKNEFSDFSNSIYNFTDLNKRYPDNIYQLTSWFNLWDLYKTMERPDSAQYYKDLIISSFPESNYAKYLQNPNFLIEEAARKDSINRLYMLAFSAFKNNDYANAAQYSRKAISMKPDADLLSKAQFIRAIAETNIMNKNGLGDSLRAYINRYPSAQPVKLAEKILSYIKEEKFTNYDQLVSSGYLNDVIKNNELLAKTVAEGELNVEKWDTDNELLHYFIIAYPSQNQVDINRLKFDLANYNLDHYTSLDFEIETENLNQETSLVIVRNFDNKESAMVYFMSIIRKPDVFKTLAGKPYLNFIVSNSNYRQMLNDRTYDEYVAYFAKNYSTLATGKFSDKELESPEALMARLKEDPNSQLKEQGEYVVIETADANYTPVKKEQLFSADHSLSHSVIIMIDDKNAGTGFLMRDLIKYNSANHREKRLRVIPSKMPDHSLLTVSSFANAYEANQYLKQIRDKKDLFSTLKTSYELYAGSEENLKKLVSTGDIEEWKKFYQINYIRKAPQAPVVKNNAEPAKAEEKPVSNVQPTVAEPESASPAAAEPEKITEQQEIISADTTTQPAVVASPVSPDVPLQETSSDSLNNESGQIQPSTPQPEPEETSPFTFNAQESHSLIYLLPAKSPNQNLLVSYLVRFNTMKYRNDGLSVKTEPFDDIMAATIISGFTSKEKAQTYIEDTKTDQRVQMSLKNANYKAYIISNSNLAKLKASKELGAYQQFYEKYY